MIDYINDRNPLKYKLIEIADTCSVGHEPEINLAFNWIF